MEYATAAISSPRCGPEKSCWRFLGRPVHRSATARTRGCERANSRHGARTRLGECGPCPGFALPRLSPNGGPRSPHSPARRYPKNAAVDGVVRTRHGSKRGLRDARALRKLRIPARGEPRLERMHRRRLLLPTRRRHGSRTGTGGVGAEAGGACRSLRFRARTADQWWRQSTEIPTNSCSKCR